MKRIFLHLIHANVQEEVCSKIHDMKRLDREERTLHRAQGYAVPRNTQKVLPCSTGLQMVRKW